MKEFVSRWLERKKTIFNEASIKNRGGYDGFGVAKKL
jgi:hypothetical protein